MAVGSLYLFEHESTKGSCMYLGFSENSITLAADTLLRNTNKDGRANKGPDLSFLEMKAGLVPGAAALMLKNILVCFCTQANCSSVDFKACSNST